MGTMGRFTSKSMNLKIFRGITSVTDGFRTSAVVEIKRHDASESCENESVIYEDLKPPMVKIIH